jgi:hypothetical protein
VIIVDTNVIAYLWLPCAETPLAERLLSIDPEMVRTAAVEVRIP